MTKRPRTRNIGTDRVTIDKDQLLIVSRANMAGWDVRKHRSSLIRFDDRTWRVAGKITGKDGLIEYPLVPWHPLDEEITGPEIEYSADYVALRDHVLVGRRRHGRIVLLTRGLTPLLGFLPARTRAQLEADYGLDPVKATFQSVVLEFVIAFMTLAIWAVGYATHAYAGGPWLVMTVIVAIDGVVRWDRIIAEQRPPPGFYEWLIRRRK